MTASQSIDTKTVTVATGESGRLDKFLSERLPDLSRSRLQALLEQGLIRRNGEAMITASHKVKAGERYHIVIPEIEPSHMVAQDIPLDIVYEDEHLLVLDKPPGISVHPGPGHPDNTLVNALLAHCGDSLSGIGGVARPGIVHRIDKDTSGLLMVAKTDAAHLALSAQLADRSLSRTYRAIAWGVPANAKGSISGNIARSFSNRQKMAVVKTGGKPAITHYTVLEGFGTLASLVECKLETGRTHQIRVHFTHLGHPLLGDPVYGAPTTSRMKSGIAARLEPTVKKELLAFNRQALHAAELRFIHPATGRPMKFEAKLPADFETLLQALSLI